MLKRFGPGLLFAGAAVGVSHLVLSTKAGAEYGFGLLWLAILANLMKYPFFEYGPRYAMATGESLLEGYRRMGKWVLWLFVIMSLGTMFTVQTAVTIVTASLASALFGIGLEPAYWALIILLFSALILLWGRYSLLDKLMKWVILTLTTTTIIAVILAIVYYSPKSTPLSFNQVISFEAGALAFFAVFTGWMPAPLDLSVWHSLWALEKRKEAGSKFNQRQSIFDFNVGYIGTTIIALLFIALGALVMYGSADSFSDKGAVFAGQLIGLYTETMGSSAALLVTIAAFTTMFSTAITCLDAQPRAMARAHYLISKDSLGTEKMEKAIGGAHTEVPKIFYFSWLIFLIIGTLIILMAFSASMGTLVKIATILSFSTTPFFALINLLLINSKLLPNEAKPPLWMLVLSWFGLIYLFGFAALYLWSIC
jgi:Mn2+/Fe2+ NRAMP family transporter